MSSDNPIPVDTTNSSSPASASAAPAPAPIRKLRLKSQFRPKSNAAAANETETALAIRSAAGSQKIPSNPSISPQFLNNPALESRLSHLPSNYNFEIPKILSRLITVQARRVALQFPEGLLLFAPIISDILTDFAQLEEVFILGDVSYGACCIDDLTSSALACDFLVHFGHSCLVSVELARLPILYVFVEISIDLQHFLNTVKNNFSRDRRVFIAGTVQFSSAIQAAAGQLKEYFNQVIIPQAKPLSRGEVLGCTAPDLNDLPENISGLVDCVLFVSDGRFHLESIMIQNPQIQQFYKYDPYSLKLTIEKYDHEQMKNLRLEAIEKSRDAKKFGLILGTLGRQGNIQILNRIEYLLGNRGIPYCILLLSEIFPAKLDLFGDVDAWIQVACPRLSIDWGSAFKKPLLSPYEAEVALLQTQWKSVYPMDFYSDSGGSWTNYHTKNQLKLRQKEEKLKLKQQQQQANENTKENTGKTIEIQFEN